MIFLIQLYVFIHKILSFTFREMICHFCGSLRARLFKMSAPVTW